MPLVKLFGLTIEIWVGVLNLPTAHVSERSDVKLWISRSGTLWCPEVTFSMGPSNLVSISGVC